VGPERVPAVHQRDAPGDALEVQRPVEGAVAAADDDDVLAGVGLEAGHEELHAPAQPALARGQRTGAELADARRDQHGAGPHLGAVVETDGDAVVVVLEGERGPVEEVLGLRGGGLLDEPLDQGAALDRREAGHVEDLLLRVHRGDLATELGERVDDGDAVPAEARVVGREEPGRPGSHDQDVALDPAHGRHPN